MKDLFVYTDSVSVDVVKIDVNRYGVSEFVEALNFHVSFFDAKLCNLASKIGFLKKTHDFFLKEVRGSSSRVF